jgi:hypothetical protein
MDRPSTLRKGKEQNTYSSEFQVNFQVDDYLPRYKYLSAWCVNKNGARNKSESEKKKKGVAMPCRLPNVEGVDAFCLT